MGKKEPFGDKQCWVFLIKGYGLATKTCKNHRLWEYYKEKIGSIIRTAQTEVDKCSINTGRFADVTIVLASRTTFVCAVICRCDDGG